MALLIGNYRDKKAEIENRILWGKPNAQMFHLAILVSFQVNLRLLVSRLFILNGKCNVTKAT
jgi:hypothetical protein